MILSDPNFKGSNGQFDPARFQAAMRQFGYSEARYVADQRRLSLRRQIAGTISAGVTPPKVMIDALSHFQNEQRSIEYVKLDAAQAGTIDPPSPETLAGYFDEHKVQFRAPEYRKIIFVPITPEEIGKWTEVSDEDAKKLYDARKDTIGTPEKREVSQIVFPTMEEATAARGRIDTGTSFDDLAKERGLKPSDVELGMLSRNPRSSIPRSPMRRFRRRRARSASRCRASSALPWSRSARSCRASRCPTTASLPV